MNGKYPMETKEADIPTKKLCILLPIKNINTLVRAPIVAWINLTAK